MAGFELKEGEGYLNRDNENPEKFWGSFKVSKDMKKGDTINLTEWINTKDDGKVIHKLQERKPKAMQLVINGVVVFFSSLDQLVILPLLLIMELIILDDGLYQLIPITKKMIEGIELFDEINCLDLCELLRLKLTGYVDTLNLHMMNDGTGAMVGCMCR